MIPWLTIIPRVTQLRALLPQKRRPNANLNEERLAVSLAGVGGGVITKLSELFAVININWPFPSINAFIQSFHISACKTYDYWGKIFTFRPLSTRYFHGRQPWFASDNRLISRWRNNSGDDALNRLTKLLLKPIVCFNSLHTYYIYWCGIIKRMYPYQQNVSNISLGLTFFFVTPSLTLNKGIWFDLDKLF